MTRQRSRRAIGALVLLAALAVAAPAAAQDPTVAPAATLSGDGRTVTGAGRSLTASQVTGLSVDGQTVTVSGSGYDVHKGVYVGLCVVPPTDYAPSPCGGGQDRTGTGGGSTWISSNPPEYAVGLPTPYGPGGTFTVTLAVAPTINESIDCRSVRCAIVTRNDHTRGSDRSQDLFLPVTFGAEAPPPTSPATAPPTTAVAAPTAGGDGAGTPVPVDDTTTSAEADADAPAGTSLVADEDEGGNGSGAALALGGGAAAVAIAAVLGVRAKRRRPIAPDA